MKKALTAVILAASLWGCSRPVSIAPYISREKSEYGDTYSFNLDLSDTLTTYSISFYTRVERRPFKPYAADSLDLGVRWIAPSDSSFLDNLVLNLDEPIASAYSSKDYRFAYKDAFVPSELGEWRLRVQVRSNPECLSGLGIIIERKEQNGTR